MTLCRRHASSLSGCGDLLARPHLFDVEGPCVIKSRGRASKSPHPDSENETCSDTSFFNANNGVTHSFCPLSYRYLSFQSTRSFDIIKSVLLSRPVVLGWNEKVLYLYYIELPEASRIMFLSFTASYQERPFSGQDKGQELAIHHSQYY